MGAGMRGLMKSPGSLILTVVWVVVAIVGCAPASQAVNQTGGGPEMQIQLSSTAFNESEAIPVTYTCDGENISPPLSWASAPQDTQSLALIVDDPDAPSGTFVHWVAFNLSPKLSSLSEGASSPGSQDTAGTPGTNSFRKSGYAGPCPPRGKPHRYFFKIYALDILLGLKSGASKADVEKAMQGHILAQGQLMGTYGR
jgi:Raf kinase inhibitor-like YbhB/YbcL family protein